MIIQFTHHTTWIKTKEIQSKIRVSRQQYTRNHLASGGRIEEGGGQQKWNTFPACHDNP